MNFVANLCGTHNLCADDSVFSREIKDPPHVSVLKIKRYETGLTQGYNWYGGFQAMGSCVVKSFAVIALEAKICRFSISGRLS